MVQLQLQNIRSYFMFYSRNGQRSINKGPVWFSFKTKLNFRDSFWILG